MFLLPDNLLVSCLTCHNREGERDSYYRKQDAEEAASEGHGGDVACGRDITVILRMVVNLPYPMVVRMVVVKNTDCT